MLFLSEKSWEVLFCLFSVNNNTYILFNFLVKITKFKRGIKRNVWSEEESSYTLSNLTNRDIEVAENHFQVKLPKA